VSTRKTRTRRRPSKKSSGGGIWSWLLTLGLVAGGIQAYEHRDSLLPRERSAKATSQSNSTRDVAAAKPRPAVSMSQTASISPNKPPVPPRPVQSLTGAKTSANVPVPSVALTALPSVRPGQGGAPETAASGTFAFCGKSGLVNCVADGNTFWVKGVKVRIAGIDVPQTDQAKCIDERARGFAAKVRLRDLLNAGSFQLASAGGTQSGAELRTVNRSGKSLGDQLVNEGLAHRSLGKKQSWCS
jgi:endonuclease YncB( thermonuclease family)